MFYGFLAVLALVAGIVLTGVFKKKWILIPMVIVIAAVLFVSSFSIIPSGYTGLRSTYGVVSETPLSNGYRFVRPIIDEVIIVDNRQQNMTLKDRVWSESSEQTTVYAEGTTITYSIAPESSVWIYTHVQNYKENLITSEMVQSAIKSATRATPTVKVTSREVIEPKVQSMLQADVDARYSEGAVVIHKVVITNMDFEDSYNQAIAQRQQAIVTQEYQAIQNETAIAQTEAAAKQRQLQADAEAYAAQQAADAEAYAILAKAEAEAEANTKINASLTQDLINYVQVQTWNGNLPTTYLGADSGALPIINIPTNTDFNFDEFTE